MIWGVITRVNVVLSGTVMFSYFTTKIDHTNRKNDTHIN